MRGEGGGIRGEEGGAERRVALTRGVVERERPIRVRLPPGEARGALTLRTNISRGRLGVRRGRLLEVCWYKP